eukprot:CAMPEP_0194260998 /NCGR_PEP_ID=MMETSP0158-20130606/45801_1 /TAXON_ID=33649 /ORGANISM="Thalassionema nitzschioides, Strain L26-B" /LENGTH=180 /DNA_ID=CAMNT_0039001103 /DNA_START=106 /DNA_END=645 /DNA_ORIENTATION=+
MSPEQQQQGRVEENAAVVAPSKEQLDNFLKNLRNSNSIREATDALIVMVEELPSDITSGHYIIMRDADSISRLAARLEALGTILTAHQQWYAQCGVFSLRALDSLARTAGTDSMAWSFIVKIGGMKTILATAKMHETKYDVIKVVLFLLWNIAIKADDGIKEEISTDECIDIVLEAMRRW